MVFTKFGDRYRGPGGPDPTKTRQQRKEELQCMMHAEDGRDIILLLTHEARGIPMGTMLPAGSLMSQMIEDILQHEYHTT
jgi:hypothetical protein